MLIDFILVPIFAIFVLFTYKFYKQLMRHHVDRLDGKLNDLQVYMGDFDTTASATNNNRETSLIGSDRSGIIIA